MHCPSIKSLVNLISPANFIPCTWMYVLMYVCVFAKLRWASLQQKSKALHLFLQKKKFYTKLLLVMVWTGGFHLQLLFFLFSTSFIHTSIIWLIPFADWNFLNHAELFISVSFPFGALLKTRGIFCLYLFWGKAKWQLNC